MKYDTDWRRSETLGSQAVYSRPLVGSSRIRGEVSLKQFFALHKLHFRLRRFRNSLGAEPSLLW